jgi:hypothetical protein
LLLTRLRKWFAYGAATALPLCWLLAVIVPCSLANGFRPDNLLPCYAAVALMGGWAVDELLRRGPSKHTLVSAVRHLLAAAPVIACMAMAAVSAAYLLHDRLPLTVANLLPMPAIVQPRGWIILPILVGVGVLGLVLAIRASLRWRLGVLVAVTVVGMLGLMHLDQNFLSRQGRTGDGQRLVQFAHEARNAIGGDQFAVSRAEPLGTELYMGRWGTRVSEPEAVTADAGDPRADIIAAGKARQAIHWMGESSLPWLITCDRGLIELGAAIESSKGSVELKLGNAERRFNTLPDSLGNVVVATEPIVTANFGRVYLIRLDWRKLGTYEAQETWKNAVWTGY